MTLATIGGILLILGSWFVYKGEIFKSVLTYALADACWLGISLSTGDYLGSSLVAVGMLLGLGAYIKMNSGKMRKTLDL